MIHPEVAAVPAVDDAGYETDSVESPVEPPTATYDTPVPLDPDASATPLRDEDDRRRRSITIV